MSDGPEYGPGEIDRLSYNPMHDYRSVDVDAWSEQWFAGFADLDPDSEEYSAVEQAMFGTLSLHPMDRESDAKDLDFGMWMLSLIGSENPYDEDSESPGERQEFDMWQRMHGLARLIGRQVVRAILDDAEQYSALRIERERSGTDYLTRTLNRYGLELRLRDLYNITNNPVRQDATGQLLQPIRLTHAYCDANNLKWVNDNLGHHVGDRLIIGTASRIQELFRQAETPIIYRQGGDEFGVILSNLTEAEETMLVSRIVDQQLQKVAGEQYSEAMEAIAERIKAVRQSGNRVRVEGRPRKLSEAEIVTGKRMRHTIYINGEAVTELFDIASLAIGAKSGWVNNLRDIEHLRREAEDAMRANKRVFQDLLGYSR